jgi:hypothetical protein
MSLVLQSRTRKEGLQLQIQMLQAQLAEIDGRQVVAWTTEFPAQPGLYWVRNYFYRWTSSKPWAGPELVQVVPWVNDPEGGFRVVQMGEEWTSGRDIMAGEWYGPIEPPEQEEI